MIKWADPIQSPLLSQRDRRYLELARRMALKSSFMRKRIGVIIVKGNKIITQGWNKVSHPIVKEFPGVDRFVYWSLHAECSALSKVKDVSGATVYLYGYKKLRSGNSEPCPLCEIYLRKREISRVVYTTPFGGIGEEVYS
jgi:dCMP deaminase